jgi:hypothetical protein
LENIVYPDSLWKKDFSFVWAVLCVFGFKVGKQC